MDNNELQHAGIKGMKWGRRRYQNPDGTWTALGKARRREGDGNDDDPNESIEAKKQRILRSKSPETIYKNSHLFTDQEISNAANRLSNEARIKALIPPKRPGMKEKIASFVKTSVAPPLIDAGKKALAKKLEDAFGLKEASNPIKELLDIGKAATTVNFMKEKLGYDVTEEFISAVNKKGIHGVKKDSAETKQTDSPDDSTTYKETLRRMNRETKEAEASAKAARQAEAHAKYEESHAKTEARRQEIAREKAAEVMSKTSNLPEVKILAKSGKSTVEEFIYQDKYKNPDGTHTYVYESKETARSNQRHAEVMDTIRREGRDFKPEAAISSMKYSLFRAQNPDARRDYVSDPKDDKFADALATRIANNSIHPGRSNDDERIRISKLLTQRLRDHSYTLRGAVDGKSKSIRSGNITSAERSDIRRMAADGYADSTIAKMLGLSVEEVKKYT